MKFFKKEKREIEQTTEAQSPLVKRSENSKENITIPSLMWFNYDPVNALRLSAVYAALSIIANSIATLPIYVKQRKDNANTIVENSPIRKLFYNMLQSKHTIIKQIVWDMLFNGNAYIYIERTNDKPTRLIYLSPLDVTIDYKKEKDIVLYNCANHEAVPTTVTQRDILHFARDTYDGIHGRGFLAFAGDIVELAGFTQKAATDYFGSGCNLTGILQFKRPLKPEQMENIRKQWQAIHTASGGGLGVLEGDSEYIPIAQGSSDSQMLETREFNITEIARFFNINPILLGDLSHSSYNSVEEAQIEFVTHTLLPIINLIEEEMNRKLLSDGFQYIDFDETELLKGNKSTISNYYTALVSNAIISINEARRALGYNPVDGGDDLIIPFTDISQNKINGQINEEDIKE